MSFQPSSYGEDVEPILRADPGAIWTPLYWHECTFSQEVFTQVMMNLIRNPNINSNHLFRADILLETHVFPSPDLDPSIVNRMAPFEGSDLEIVVIRRLIPRNMVVDKPLDQTCLVYKGTTRSHSKSLVIYLPHISSPSEAPFYHPAVQGIAFLYNLNHETQETVISIHYSFFAEAPQTPFLDRTAQHLLRTLYKHGQGLAAGYVKRVHHDMILPQATVQNTYSRLKAKYARALIASWVEVTDPTKHVFEDLGIAAFLIELWAEMYSAELFPGFVDIGCGNGLLVHILLEEGFSGWGFDARRRKSWNTYPAKATENLKELVLVPTLTRNEESGLGKATSGIGAVSQESKPGIHSGEFPKGTFIISNHADELTPWTPILSALSESPFMMIPCCSHNLNGLRFRAPPPKDSGTSSSTYASLVAWVTKLAADCGWNVEKEMLRIPSTRNTALLGRGRTASFCDVNISEILKSYGGATGWEENAMKLIKNSPRGH